MTKQLSDNFERSEAPHVECPRCNKETFVADYFEHGVGSEIECDHCGAMLKCIEEERPVVWTWQLKEVTER
jgi:ribosomal protein S27E